MSIKYISYNNHEKFGKSYLIKDNDDEIGCVEGHLSRHGDLTTILKIFNNNYKEKGLGFQAFKKVFEELNTLMPIKTIKGSWHSGEEFQDFENGMSTNLKVFTENLNNGKDETESAFSTPTGKWARKLGYEKCYILSKSISEVLVDFTK